VGVRELATLVELVAWRILIFVSGYAAPVEGLTLDSQLARDPSSGCIATTRSSLPGSK
jgi:hypothetical protein